MIQLAKRAIEPDSGYAPDTKKLARAFLDGEKERERLREENQGARGEVRKWIEATERLHAERDRLERELRSAQAERNEARETVRLLREDSEALKTDLDALRRQVTTYEAALRFYAEPGDEEKYSDDCDVITAEGDSEVIDEIPGKRARNVLSQFSETRSEGVEGEKS